MTTTKKIFSKHIKCHTFSERQVPSDLNDDDDNDNNDDDDDDDINDDNKEKHDDNKKLIFQKYQVPYLFGTTSLV